MQTDDRAVVMSATSIYPGDDVRMLISALSGGLPQTVTVTDGTSLDGRPVWIVTSAPSGATIDLREEVTFDVDKATGLIVRYLNEWYGVDGTRIETLTTLTDLATDVDMPAAYPGEFPPGAVVSRGEG
jgi:hypothetical protein